MNCHKLENFGLIIFIVLMVSTITSAKSVFAETANNIDATIKISVCGDSAVEYPENCEGQHLDSQTCNSLGYSGGNLDCDVACTFDTTDCIPTPSPTVAPTSTPGNSSNNSSSNTGGSSSSQNGNTNLIVNLIRNITKNIELPSILAALDPGHDNKIGNDEIKSVATLWVKSWSEFIGKGTEVEKCDINLDKSCDLFDFSVLLYYVER
jgi:hypothetical protein